MLKPVSMPDLRQRTRGTYTSRVKIPRDVAADYARTFGQRWSVKQSWKGLTEPQARAESARWANIIQARFKALRDARAGQRRSLDHRELHALAGIWYVDYMDRYEANPAPPESYDGEIGNIILEDELGAEVEVPGVDAWLLDHGHALTPQSRADFLEILAPLYVQALSTLAKRARGDYSRDPIRDTFPTLELHSEALTLSALWGQWVKEKKPAHGTVRRWKAVIDAANAQWPDARKITEADARTWLKSWSLRSGAPSRSRRSGVRHLRPSVIGRLTKASSAAIRSPALRSRYRESTKQGPTKPSPMRRCEQSSRRPSTIKARTSTKRQNAGYRGSCSIADAELAKPRGFDAKM